MTLYERPPNYWHIQALFERIDADITGGNPILTEDEIRDYIGSRVRGVGERLLDMDGEDVEFYRGRINADNINNRSIIEAILIQSRGVRPAQTCSCCRRNRSRRTFPMCLHVPDPLTFQGICGNCKATGRPSRACNAMIVTLEARERERHQVRMGRILQILDQLLNGV
ncbi:uncharacterized protein BP01DRAFT_65126 [Aspergillus saccharolyticus JOP 1030-1]|uniref:Uncharacterized protein n=1 Tax=Aspergillus saccharolyticus JOP 1030-1 TaxID=1450539 RepID=A0A318ZJK0_9EURO|nr:hypothetical protein BP01DRAFT_65126 [Aspergillus saccharolyticus JOP 1030-1]PYH44733.1 hypothetical protein BP01DRAFT_65126 [Aspergillus saccharolyticus JOP 1030-1]